MIAFTVRERENKVWIGDNKTAFSRFEILLHYLNMKTDKIEKMRHHMLEMHRKSRYTEEYADNYNENVHKAQSLIYKVIEFFAKLPPYNRLEIPHEMRSEGDLLLLLNQYKYLFEYDADDDEYIEPDEESDNLFVANEMGYTDILTGETFLDMFIIDDCTFEDGEFDEDIAKLNRKIDELFGKYISLLDDVLRVKKLYAPFLDAYNSGDKQKALQSLFAAKGQVDPAMYLNRADKMNIIYKLDESGELCRTAEYTSLGAFLYMELMEGLEDGTVPRKCANCGRYFLQAGGYDTEYCDNIAPRETTKTCKDVGAKNTFDQKVKTNPVWQLHQRAYKTHYARMKKKNMTQQEFLDWSEKAADLRDQCLAGRITVDEFKAFVTEDLRYKKK